MSDRNSVNGTANGGLGDVLLGAPHMDDATVREPAPSLHDAAVRNGAFEGELLRPAHLGSTTSHTNEVPSHDETHNVSHAYDHTLHSLSDSTDSISDSALQNFDSSVGTDNSDAQIWTPQYSPLESRGADHLGDQQLGNELSGAHSNGAPPPAVAETGQLWEADLGTTSGNPDGHSDVRLEHDDSDGQAADQIDEHDFSSAGALNSVGLDTAADLWFTVDNNDVLHVGHISTGAEIGTGTTIASTSDDDLVWSMVVDPRHDVIYEQLFGGDYQVTDPGETHARGGEIIEIAYNPTTGAISTPYNPNTFANNINDILADSGSSNDKIALVRSMSLSSDGSTMYFADDNDADPGAFYGFKTNAIYSMSTVGSVGGGNAPTPTLLTDTSQFNTNVDGGNNYTTPYITGLAVNNAQGIIYFTTDATGENTNTAADAIWWMPVTGGTATKMTLPAGVTLDFDAFFSSGVIFDPEGRQLYVSDVQRDAIIQLTLSADGHTFTSGNNDFRTVDTNGDGASTSSMTWDSLPVLGNITATTTEAVQGGGAITLLTATPTISDPDGTGLNLRQAQVVITNAQAGDVLTASTVGTGITANYNTTTHTLTLSGDDTYAHYEQVLNSVQFQDTGTDNSTGSHPTRTIDIFILDGTTEVSQTTLDPNEKAITVVIDRAPTLTSDNYSPVQENGTQLGSAGTGGTGVLGNDNDKDGDAITITAVNGSGANVGQQIAGTYGHLQLFNDGHFEYDATMTSNIDGAATGSHPVDTFTYTVSDGLGGVTTTTVSFTINRAPTLTADAPTSQALENGSPVTGNVLTNDTDHDGDSIVVSAVNGGSFSSPVAGTYGSLTMNASGGFSYSADNTSAIDAAATGSHLTDTFTYTVSDGHSGSTTTTLTVTLDRAPTVVTDSANTTESGTVTTNAATGVLANDSDRDGDTLTVSAISGGGLNTSTPTTYGHITMHADGSYSYVADNTSAIDAAATGSHPVDTITFSVSDGFGGTTTETLNITIDRAAVAAADSLDTTENSEATVGSGSPVNANLLTNDVDKDGDAITITAVNGSSLNVNNQITLASGALLTVHADGTYTYDPNHVFDYLAGSGSGASNNTATDTFTYTVDGGSTVTVTITINGVDSNDTLVGTTGNDTLIAGVGDDIIYDDNGLNFGKDPHDTSAGHSGGTDSFSGGSGDDTFYMGGNLIAADHIDGGTNIDKVVLNGDYSAGLVFTATTMVNVETLALVAGHDYNLTIDNATVAAGQTLRLQAGTLGAGDNVIFDGSNDTTGGRLILNTGAGNDVLTGGNGDDVFRPGTGNDTIHGGGGNDKINMAGNLTAADSIDGGIGDDTLVLKGDYSAGVVFGASTVQNIETIYLSKNFSYNLTMNAATVASGETLTLQAGSLGASDAVTFDGSADVAGGNFIISTGAGNDVLTGGVGDDTFRSGAGNDTIHAGDGNDVINMGAFLTAADTIDGGAGTDTIILNGDYAAGLTFGSTTMTNVEQINLEAGHSYDLTFDISNVLAGQTLTIKGTGLGVSDNMTIDGSALGAGSTLIINDGNGHDTLIGGGGNDIIRVGSGNDTITGNGGADKIIAGIGDDTFVYSQASDSTSTTYDTIQGFDALNDHFQLLGFSINAINAEVTAGRLDSGANFDTDLAGIINAAHLGAHDAVLFTASKGDLHGHTFLVVDLNGVAGYQAGQDIVIDVTGGTHLSSLSTGNFI
jgi:VCBS repeat-containing protein